MSMAGAKVLVMLDAMEKSPLFTVLCTMLFEFTIATRRNGTPISFTMVPAEMGQEGRDDYGKHMACVQ